MVSLSDFDRRIPRSWAALASDWHRPLTNIWKQLKEITKVPLLAHLYLGQYLSDQSIEIAFRHYNEFFSWNRSTTIDFPRISLKWLHVIQPYQCVSKTTWNCLQASCTHHLLIDRLIFVLSGFEVLRLRHTVALLGLGSENQYNKVVLFTSHLRMKLDWINSFT